MERLRTSRILVGSLAAFMLVVTAPDSEAAEVEGRWGADLQGGLWKLTEGYWDHSNVSDFLGAGLRLGLGERWTAGLSYRYGTLRPGVENPAEDAGLTLDAFTPLHTEIHNPMLSFEYLMRPGHALRPYAGLGAGLMAWRVLAADDAGIFPSGTTVQGYASDGDQFEQLQSTDLMLAVELGAEWWPSDDVSVRLGARYGVMPGNDLDNIGFSSWNLTGSADYVDANKGLLQGVLGATFWFGGVSDADDDGIEDSFDRCPRSAEDYDGFQDDDGCPDYDNDEDGVPDADDRCPDDPEDRDGFQDDDGCPDPDNDGDGIVDARDRAPDQAEDVDGFEDLDGAPDPDNDGDGVLDAADVCPDTPAGAEVDDRGCLVEEQEVEEPVADVAQTVDVGAMADGLVLEGVSFRSGSAQIQPSSLAILQRVARSLDERPRVRIEVRGHTDSAGSAEVNRQLSHRRAVAVRDFLIQLGVNPSRVTAVGYGEDYPIASNETRAGRAANRRVELHRID